MRKNCWEFKKCGREKGGLLAHDLGVCPASLEQRLDGTHGGRNAGRACWVVAGTLCHGTVQGTYAHKYGSCGACDFYLDVKQEEFPAFTLAAVLLERVQGKTAPKERD